MAARVSVQSGSWSASGTWGAPVPTSGDGATSIDKAPQSIRTVNNLPESSSDPFRR